MSHRQCKHEFAPGEQGTTIVAAPMRATRLMRSRSDAKGCPFRLFAVWHCAKLLVGRILNNAWHSYFLLCRESPFTLW